MPFRLQSVVTDWVQHACCLFAIMWPSVTIIAADANQFDSRDMMVEFNHFQVRRPGSTRQAVDIVPEVSIVTQSTSRRIRFAQFPITTQTELKQRVVNCTL